MQERYDSFTLNLDRKQGMEDNVKCPKCGSTQIHAGMRGWSWKTGILGSGKIYITCLKCGFRFRPGAQAQVRVIRHSELTLKEVEQRDRDDKVMMRAIGFIVGCFILIFMLGGPAFLFLTQRTLMQRSHNRVEAMSAESNQRRRHDA